jgi:hypothetical protein
MMNKTRAMSWINEVCGAGWLPLVEEVFDQLPADVQVEQVYQKYGSLRFDLIPRRCEFASYVKSVEERSLGMCEICGEPGTEKIVDCWVRTRCETHS